MNVQVSWRCAGAPTGYVVARFDTTVNRWVIIDANGNYVMNASSFVSLYKHPTDGWNNVILDQNADYMIKTTEIIDTQFFAAKPAAYMITTYYADQKLLLDFHDLLPPDQLTQSNVKHIIYNVLYNDSLTITDLGIEYIPESDYGNTPYGLNVITDYIKNVTFALHVFCVKGNLLVADIPENVAMYR